MIPQAPLATPMNKTLYFVQQTLFCNKMKHVN